MFVLDGLWNAFRMAWEVWWALVLGFTLSGIVQAWVPRSKLQRALGGAGAREVALATGLGAASSSCSYAAIAIAKSLFQKGASFAAAMAFQFASTNLVFELGIVMWIFLGWKFTLAEFVGGFVLIALMWLGVRLFISKRLEEDAREHALAAQAGHQHGAVESGPKLFSLQAWSAVAHNFRADWEMLWKEIVGGFLIAGYVSLLPTGFFNGLFITGHGGALRLLENVVVGPIVAALAFVYADLIVVPIVLIYRKYYGGKVTALLVAIMFATMVAAALIVDGIFSALDLVPTHRPSIESITERDIAWNYTTALNIVFLLVAAALVGLTLRRGAKDPVCGMTVDRKTPHTSEYHGQTVYFCSAHCKQRFDEDPERYVGPREAPVLVHAGEPGHHG